VRLTGSVNATAHAGAGLDDLLELPPRLDLTGYELAACVATGRLLKSGN
jgi:hypothetical protein